MKRTGSFVGIVFILLLVGGVAYIASTTGTAPTPGNVLRFMLGTVVTGESITQECHALKQQYCKQGTPTAADYPDKCFRNGNHVLQQPYSCS